MNDRIIASCSNCQAQFEVSSALLGKQGRCPQCQATFTIGSDQQPNPDPRQPGQVPGPPSPDPRQPGPVPHPQQFPQQQFPQQQQQQFAAPMGSGSGMMEAQRGGLILGMALAGLFLFTPLCIVAVVMGKGDLKKMDHGRMDPSGRGTTNAGVVLGWIGIGLLILGVALVCVIVAAVGAGGPGW